MLTKLALTCSTNWRMRGRTLTMALMRKAVSRLERLAFSSWPSRPGETRHMLRISTMLNLRLERKSRSCWLSMYGLGVAAFDQKRLVGVVGTAALVLELSFPAFEGRIVK